MAVGKRGCEALIAHVCTKAWPSDVKTFVASKRSSTICHRCLNNGRCCRIEAKPPEGVGTATVSGVCEIWTFYVVTKTRGDRVSQ